MMRRYVPTLTLVALISAPLGLANANQNGSDDRSNSGYTALTAIPGYRNHGAATTPNVRGGRNQLHNALAMRRHSSARASDALACGGPTAESVAAGNTARPPR
jgi:hypothetical protein